MKDTYTRYSGCINTLDNVTVYMTKGTLGALVCPILEDELLYNIRNDDDIDEIVLIENEHIKSVRPKMDHQEIQYRMCSEEDFLNGKVLLPNDYNLVIWMMDMGLHAEPEELKDHLHDSCKRIQGRVDAITLYYGLCGNGLKNIEEWGKENLSVPVTIMKDQEGRICDDCIAVAVGGCAQYLKLLRKYPGIMYFTPAYATNWDEMKYRMDIFRGFTLEDGTDMTKMLFEMAGYKYVMEIPTGLGDAKLAHKEAKKFAKEMGLKVIQLEKDWCSLEPTKLIHENSKSLLE